MRRRPRIDETQPAIVQAFRHCGFSVQSLASVGSGCPDLLVARAGRLYLVECKTATGRATPDQRRWQLCWNSHVFIARSVDEVITFAQALDGIEIRES